MRGPEAGAGCGGWGAPGHLKGGLTALEDELRVCVEGQRSPGWCWRRSLAGVLGGQASQAEKRPVCLGRCPGMETGPGGDGVCRAGDRRAGFLALLTFHLHLFFSPLPSHLLLCFKFPCSEVQVCCS